MRVTLLFGVLLALLLCATVQAESVERVDAELVPDLGMAIYDLPPSALQLTRFEKHVAEEMALHDPSIRSMLEHTAVMEFKHEGENEAETEESAALSTASSSASSQDESADSEEGGEDEGEAEAEGETEMEAEEELEAETQSDEEVHLDAETEAELENELTSDSPVSFLEMEEEAPPQLVVPKIIKGTVGLPHVDPPKKTVKPCPDKKKRPHHHGRHRQSRQGSLIEVMEASGADPARKVHIHVKTKLHGGEGSENLLRVEDRFDRLHDRVMGRLNRLMSRIKRHPETIEDKVATFHFTE